MRRILKWLSRGFRIPKRLLEALGRSITRGGSGGIIRWSIGIAVGFWALSVAISAAITGELFSQAVFQWITERGNVSRTVFGVLLGIVTAFGALTAWRVCQVLRSELKGWESLLLDIRYKLRWVFSGSEAIRMLCYTPNPGDISLRKDEPARRRAYVPFQADFLQSIELCYRNGVSCEIICYPDGAIHDMLLGLRAYGERALSTYTLIQRMESMPACAVWRMERVPPQHFFIIGSRVGYRFLVTAESVKGVHDVRAICSEDGDEVSYMNKVWESCCSALALPRRGDVGFWMVVFDDGCAAIWGDFQEQTKANEIHVQVSDGPTFDEDVPFWRFPWAADGRFMGQPGTHDTRRGGRESRPLGRLYTTFRQLSTRAQSRIDPKAARYFRVRIVKNKLRPDTKKPFMTEWSRSFRPFLPLSHAIEIAADDETTLMEALQKRAAQKVHIAFDKARTMQSLQWTRTRGESGR